jgi:hypothetical protein
MNDILRQFKDWRKENNLPFNPNFVPRSYDSIKDLDDGYSKRESAAVMLEQELKQKAAAPAPPAARPKRTPTVTTFKNGIRVRPDGYVTGDDLKALMEFIKTEMNDIQEATQAALNKRLLWRGTWRSGETYAVNDMVQDKGTVWVAVAAKAEGRPGADSGWRMLVKTQERAAK